MRVGLRFVVSWLAVGVCLVGVCSSAAAGTVAVETRLDGSAGVVFRAEPGVLDRISVSPSQTPGAVVLTWGSELGAGDGRTLAAGAGCTSLSGYGFADAYAFECLGPTDMLPPVLFTGDRRDSVDLRLVGDRAVSIFGGPGDDRIASGPVSLDAAHAVQAAWPVGPVVITGGPGDDSIQQHSASWSRPWEFPPRSCRYSGALRGGLLTGGPGEDGVCDTSGADTIMVRDGERDVAGCTEGKDTVVADRLDFVAGDCERIRRRSPVGAVPLALEADDEFDVPWYFVLGCSADGPKVCVGELRVRRPQPPRLEKPRGLMVSKPFRLRRGRVTWLTVNPPYLDANQAVDWGVRTVTITELPSGTRVRAGRTLRPPEPYEGE
jgi:hypothetical protein